MSAALVALFAPYCQGAARMGLLERALEQLSCRELRGMRPLLPAGGHPFVLRWRAGVAPLEPAQVELAVSSPQFESDSTLYSFEVTTHQLVRWLMDWLEAGGGSGHSADLPESFWQWLILGIEPAATRT